jgi:hypothetical protein
MVIVGVIGVAAGQRAGSTRAFWLGSVVAADPADVAERIVNAVAKVLASPR